MFAIEKPKQPKVIKYIWWSGFNKEEVGYGENLSINYVEDVGLNWKII